MPLDISDLLTPVPAAAAPVSIRFPGGIRMSGQLPNVAPATSLENASMALGRMTSGLGPLGSVFALIEAVIAIKDFAEAVPGLIVDPSPVVEAIEKLVAAISKLLQLVPQLSIPILVFDVIVAVIALLEGLLEEIGALAEQLDRIAEAEALVEDAPDLEPILDQAKVDVATSMANLEASLGEVGAILAVVNGFASAIGLDPIPVGGSIGSDPTAAVAILEDLVAALSVVRDAIPV